MKNIISFINCQSVLIIVSVLLLIFCEKKHFIKNIKAEKGILGTKDWYFDYSGPLRLDGEWESYWNQLLTLQDFNNNELKPKSYIKIPGTWKGVILQNNEKISSDGFATFRLKIIGLNTSKPLRLNIKNEATSYILWINEEKIS